MATKLDPAREAALLAAAADVIEQTDFDPDAAALADEATEQAREAAIEAARTAPIATITAPDSPAVSLTFAQLKELMQASQANAPTYEQIADIATRAAQAGADRVKTREIPISETARKSPFNPLGERDHPRPKLKCAMYLGAAPLGSTKEVTVLTHEEIAALNDLTPGHYRIQKLDRSRVVIEVKGQVNSNQQLDRLWILLPAGDEEKNLYPPLDQLVRACCDDNRVNPGL